MMRITPHKIGTGVLISGLLYLITVNTAENLANQELIYNEKGKQVVHLQKPTSESFWTWSHETTTLELTLNQGRVEQTICKKIKDTCIIASYASISNQTDVIPSFMSAEFGDQSISLHSPEDFNNVTNRKYKQMAEETLEYTRTIFADELSRYLPSSSIIQ